jgi:hypothetical protein
MFDLKKEMEEFDQMLSEMTGEEVMEMLIDNGYGKIKSPSDFGYIGIFDDIYKNNLSKED